MHTAPQEHLVNDIMYIFNVIFQTCFLVLGVNITANTYLGRNGLCPCPKHWNNKSVCKIYVISKYVEMWGIQVATYLLIYQFHCVQMIRCRKEHVLNNVHIIDETKTPTDFTSNWNRNRLLCCIVFFGSLSPVVGKKGPSWRASYCVAGRIP